MAQHPFDFCIFIGHFSPYSLGHHNLMKRALESADRVICVLGSHNKARDISKPWISEERIQMIKSALSDEEIARVSFICIKDQLYADVLWTEDLLEQVSQITNKNSKIAFICGSKDNSDYLQFFPQWESLVVKQRNPSVQPKDIRRKFFTFDNSFKDFVHSNVAKFMKDFEKTENFTLLKSDFDFIQNYRAKWEGAPHPPIFNTVDAVVLQSAHILVVRRKRNPGKSLLALPGGFLNQDEEIEVAAVRELKEETSIALEKSELAKHVVKMRVFSDPKRSLRGRTITFAHLFDLGSGPLTAIEKTDADDEIADCFWLPINEMKERESEFFEDHFHIAQSMIRSLRNG